VISPEQEGWLIREFGLSVGGLESGGWWQFVTYAFLHGNLLHLALNMVSLFFAGRLVEEEIGGWRFLLLYALGALGGGVGQMLLAPSVDATLVGASGSVFAVMLAFATIFRDQEILALVFFILPVHFRAKYLGWVLVGFSAMAIVVRFEPWIGHAAHLGGAITGYLFARVQGFGKPLPPETWIRRVFRRP
jgi:membrane associated rhomboid family serine protease